MQGEPWRLSATELAATFIHGETTPSEYLEVLLARIERVNPRINAVVCIDPRAREAARASTARLRAGARLSPLDGVPIAVKDNILVQGLPTSWGSRAFRDSVSAEDEFPVKCLREQGAVILGKTNCPEFTLDGYTGNLLYGTTRNPWNPDLTPGGSSGGAVAGVAAGLFPLALGTDGGGSIRRPASHTGLVGYKPSIGAIARFPTLPQILLDFEVIGPIARTVEDATLLYNAMCGPQPRDRLSMAARAQQVTLDAPRPLRILYVPRFGTQPLDGEIAASVDTAAALLAGLGHHVESGVLPLALDPIVEFWPLLGQVGLAYVFDQNPSAQALAAPRFADMAEAGRAVSAARYLQGIEAVRAFRSEVAAAFADFDLLLTPSAAARPWPADELFPPRIDGQEVGPRGHALYTGWVNACGHPAINLPCSPARDGVPIGFQLIAPYAEDEILFRIAAQYQRAFPFYQRWPALAESA